jgi:hypothetical protein
VFQIAFPTSTNFIRFLSHFYLFPALEIDFGGILIWKTCRVGPTCQPAFLIAPRPMRQGSSSSWSACQAQRTSSRHHFLPTLSGPKPRSPSSLPHCSGASPRQSPAIRIPPLPLPSSSNRLIVLVPGRAPIERLTAARTKHVAPELLLGLGRLAVHITERSPLMPSTNELLRHQRRPCHPEHAAPPSPSKLPQRRSERAAPPPLCLRVRCRPPSPIVPAPQCHLCASRQCPGVHLDAAPLSHYQGRAALYRHQAATTLHKRVCVASAESTLPVPLLPCLPSPCRVQGVRGNA